MTDETKRVDRAREDRVQQAQREQVKPRPKETDFDRLLERGKQAYQPTAQQQVGSKAATEEAIREAMKREDRRGDEQKRDDDERKDDRDTHQKSERSESRVSGEKVIAKGRLKHGSGEGGGGGRQSGYGGSASKREQVKILTKMSAKSLPVDLQGKFAKRLAETMKGAQAANQAILTQQILNKIVQCVRIGINRKGEKEIQLDLHERIFRGLKLRVVAREGKIDVHFKTSDAKGREALSKNSDAIRAALKKRGIDVDEIEIS